MCLSTCQNVSLTGEACPCPPLLSSSSLTCLSSVANSSKIMKTSLKHSFIKSIIHGTFISISLTILKSWKLQPTIYSAIQYNAKRLNKWNAINETTSNGHFDTFAWLLLSTLADRNLAHSRAGLIIQPKWMLCTGAPVVKFGHPPIIMWLCNHGLRNFLWNCSTKVTLQENCGPFIT